MLRNQYLLRKLAVMMYISSVDRNAPGKGFSTGDDEAAVSQDLVSTGSGSFMLGNCEAGGRASELILPLSLANLPIVSCLPGVYVSQCTGDLQLKNITY